MYNTARWILDDTLNDKVYSPISVGRDKLMRAYYLLENAQYYEVLPLLDLLDEIYFQKGLFFEFIFSNVFRTIVLYETGEQQWLDYMYTKVSTYNKRLTYIKAEYNKEHKKENCIELTKREKEVLINLCQGLTREEIAESLYISVSTVKHTLNSIYSKLGALNSTDAVRIAMELKII